MGSFYDKIILKNASDVGNVGVYIDAQAVREIEVNALIDTGAMTLVINEDTRKALGLRIVGQRLVTTANDVRQTAELAEPVWVCWKDRSMVCEPLVLPSGNVLLGAIPMENMDLMVDIVNGCLVGAHGDQIVVNVM